MATLINEREFRNFTKENGLREAKAVKKWARLLECNTGFDRIKTKAAKKTTAMLLENQMRYLTEASQNTSIFGATNGLQGGALGNADGYARGDFRVPRIVLPMVRRIFPALMSNDTVGVQPMPGPVALAYALRYYYKQGALNRGDNGTSHVHEATTKSITDTGLVGDPRGIKGVETRTTFHPTDNKLVIIKGADYPMVQDIVTFEEVTVENNKKVIAKVTPLAMSYIGVTGDISGVDYQINAAGFIVHDSTSATPYTVFDNETAALAALDSIVTAKIGDTKEVKTIGLHGDKQISATNAEMGYQRLDTRHTGKQDARLMQKLANGRWQFRPEDSGVAALLQQYEGTGAIPQVGFRFEKTSVEAGTRRIGTSWTLEIEEDLKNTNGIDIESESIQQMTFELQAEIDREMTVRMLYSALSNNEYSVFTGELADARWLGERNRAFYQNIIQKANRMAVRNRRGAANFIVCTPNVSTLLETLEDFVAMPVQTSVTTSQMATAKIGTLNGNRFAVYQDTRTPVYNTADYGAGYEEMFDPAGDGAASMPDYCLLGYKGTENYDAGIIYCPYIPIMIQQAVDPYSFEPQVGLATRYGVIDNLFGAHLYYHVIIIDSFAQPGMPDKYKAMYPAGALTAGLAPAKDAPDAPKFAFPVEHVTP